MPRGSWSAPELMRLRELFPRTAPARLARLLGRSEAAVVRRAHRMFASERRRGRWTAADDRVLREGYGVHGLDTLAMLVGRAPEDVAERIAAFRRVLRTGSWADDEVAMLKRLHGTRRDDDLAIGLSRTRDDVERMARALCLAKDKAAGVASGVRMPRWTAEEVARLRQLYGTRENLEIARVLGRSVASIANKAFQLGLGKNPAALRRMGRKNLARRRRR